MIRSFVAVAVLAALTWGAVGDTVQSRPLPRLGRVRPFVLQDQDGAAVTRASLEGEPWVASFFFARCPTVCPLITSRMLRLKTLAAQRDAPLRLVSISVDPEHDTPDVLRQYASSYGASWSMLTGNEQSVQALAESFAVALEGQADPEELNYGILHSGHLVLVDGVGVIRGYYNSGDDDIEAEILADARRLHTSG